jgi:hypothetical protein
MERKRNPGPGTWLGCPHSAKPIIGRRVAPTRWLHAGYIGWLNSRACRRREGGDPVIIGRDAALTVRPRRTSGIGGYLIPALGHYVPSAGMTVPVHSRD